MAFPLIQIQKDGLASLFCLGTSYLNDQPFLNKKLYQRGNGGFGKPQHFGKVRSGNRTIVDNGFQHKMRIDITDQFFASCLHVSPRWK